MSFSLWTMACEVIPKAEGLADARVRQARMHPQSTGGLWCSGCAPAEPYPPYRGDRLNEGASPVINKNNTDRILTNTNY
jgi:hypothetical protein